MAKAITASYLILLSFISTVSAQNFDINALKSLHGNRNTSLDNTMCAISNIAPYIQSASIPALYSYGAYQKNSSVQKQAISMGIGFGTTLITTYTLKRIINRPRPGATYPQYIKPLHPLYRYSFPSGHSSSSFWWATSMSYTTKKWYLLAPVWALAGTVAYSRMHIGVHYPSDVAAGAALGIGSAILAQRINKSLQKNKTAKNVYNKIIW